LQAPSGRPECGQSLARDAEFPAEDHPPRRRQPARVRARGILSRGCCVEGRLDRPRSSVTDPACVGPGRRATGARGCLGGTHSRGLDARPRQGRARLHALMKDDRLSGRRRPMRSDDKANGAMRVKDKVAIVTGAASGIGKEIALTYAREGAKVAIADLNKAAAGTVAEEIAKAQGKAMPIGMDVTNEAQVEQGVEEVVSAYGGVD